MPLKVSDGIGAWIKDFKKSDAPQFKGKSEKERRDQAIAAYLSAKRGPQKEDFTFKVDIDGLPSMFMPGNSPGQVKNHLRKLIKQPSMIKGVERQTKHDVKKMYRKKAQGKDVDEQTVSELSPDTIKSYKKAASDSNYRAASKYARIARSPTGKKYKDKEMAKQDDIMRKRKAGLARADNKEDMGGYLKSMGKKPDKSSDVQNYMTLKKMMKKKKTNEGTMGDAPEWGTKESDRKARKVTPGQKCESNCGCEKCKRKMDEKITLAKVRGAMYKSAKALGDVQAVRKKKVGKRVARRVAGKVASRVLRKLIK